MAFIITKKGVRTAFHRSIVTPNLNKGIEFRFLDGSQNSVDPGQIAWNQMKALMGHPGGAYITKSIKHPVVIADSIPIIE